MPLYFFSFFYAVMAMAVMVPLAIQWGFRYGIVDQAPCKDTTNPDKSERIKIHCKTTPRSGGIAIFISFWLAIFLSIGFTTELVGIFLGSLIIFLVMLIDDRSNLRPAVKLLAQIVAATVPVFFGIRVYFLSNVFSNSYIAVGWLGVPFTILWAVGFMNALNLIDGMDGLASGIAGIASLGIVFLSISRMMPVAAVFENRFQVASELNRMGARIVFNERMATVFGVEKLNGAMVESQNLRAGASLVLAALAADGESEISGIETIDRGYEMLETKLAACGGHITRMEDTE